MAEFIKLFEKNPDTRKLGRVVECLRDGGVVIYPTDTIYGMGCDIHQTRSVERICQIKGIKPNKADFSFICHNLSHIADYARVGNATFKLMKRALPGPFTFILEATNLVPKLLHTNKKNVGIRIPAHEIPRMLVEQLGNPIITTTLKDDEEYIEYTTDPELIFERYQNLVDIVIDCGYGGHVPSTIVDATDDDFTILRQGLGQLEDFL
jgi:tRNA threonylcarbamoyl adenosine modification protein (Sua5/YciO/YrdC/YwlC family)